jgi:hypothetical protein
MASMVRRRLSSNACLLKPLCTKPSFQSGAAWPWASASSFSVAALSGPTI